MTTDEHMSWAQAIAEAFAEHHNAGAHKVAELMKAADARINALIADKDRLDWLCKHTEFRFSIFDSATKKFLRENNAMGVVIRPVIDAAMEKYPNP